MSSLFRSILLWRLPQALLDYGPSFRKYATRIPKFMMFSVRMGYVVSLKQRYGLIAIGSIVCRTGANGPRCSWMGRWIYIGQHTVDRLQCNTHRKKERPSVVIYEV